MKLFVAVVTFVVVPFVFADDVAWEIAPPFSLMPGGGGQERGQAPKDHMTDSDEKEAQAQNSQQNTGNVPILKVEPNTKTSQTANQQSQGNVYPNEDPHGGWNWVDSLRWIVPSIIALIALFFTALSHKRNKRVDKLALDKDRALLAFDKWELLPHDAKKMLTKDDDPDTIRCVLLSIGGSSATLGNSYCDRWVVNEKPTIPDFRKKLSSKLKGKVVTEERPFLLSLEPLNTVDRKAVDRRQKAIYVFVYIEYTDPFRGEYEECSLMRYHVDEGFASVELPEGTCDEN